MRLMLGQVLANSSQVSRFQIHSRILPRNGPAASGRALDLVRPAPARRPVRALPDRLFLDGRAVESVWLGGYPRSPFSVGPPEVSPASAFWSWAIPRAIRDLTVPIGTRK